MLVSKILDEKFSVFFDDQSLELGVGFSLFGEIDPFFMVSDFRS